MSAPRHGLDYVEITCKDLEACRSFYQDAFDWKFSEFGSDYLSFNDGRMRGGLVRAEEAKLGGPLLVLYSDDLLFSTRRVIAAGGRITRDIFAFPGGFRFHFSDPEGRELAVWSDQDPSDSTPMQP